MKRSVVDISSQLTRYRGRLEPVRRVDKEAAPSDSPPSKTKVRGGRRTRHCSGSAIFSEEAWAEIGRGLRLSRRELQIIRGIFDDLTEFAIASDLGISSHTVHTHVERLHRKMDVKDRVELLLRVMCEFIRLTTAADSTLPPICARRAAGRCPLRD